jgi:hypothetical protein
MVVRQRPYLERWTVLTPRTPPGRLLASRSRRPPKGTHRRRAVRHAAHAVTGRTLKAEPVRWEAFQNIREARNKFAHEAVANRLDPRGPAQAAVNSVGEGPLSGQVSGQPTSAGPVVTITSAPPAMTTSHVASVAFTSTNPANSTLTFTCSLDGAAATSCTSPSSFSSLADGAHSFSVRVTDGYGSTSMASTSWFVDSTAPTIRTRGGSGVATYDIRWRSAAVERHVRWLRQPIVVAAPQRRLGELERCPGSGLLLQRPCARCTR